MSEKSSDIFASYQIESSVVNGIADKVFELIRNFGFDRLCPSQVSSVNFVHGQPGLVGSIVEVRRPNNQKVKWHIVEISDYNRSMMYELIEADPPFQSSNVLNTIRVFKDTMCSNKCFLRWETNYSNDVQMDELARMKSLKCEVVRTLNGMFGEGEARGTEIPSKVEIPASKASGAVLEGSQRENIST